MEDSKLKEIKLKQFLFNFCDDIRSDKRFCFILGAGASKSSGIPTGSELATRWLEELTKIHGSEDFETWIKAEDINKDHPAMDYSKIFDKRFEIDEKYGFYVLEEAMEGKEPSCGYSVLAQILDKTQHKIVITTNFDSLTEDALFIYSQKKPLVIGHESLAKYIDPFIKRPLIIKVHRDLFLTPKNKENETTKIEENYKKNLTSIFQNYTPIIIGYGGNDGSLMEFLEKQDKIEGGIFWCYLKNNEELNGRIQNLIIKHKGYAVPIPGFDDLMIQIGNKLEFERLDDKIIKIANTRAKKYREQIENLTEKNDTVADTKEALTNIVSRGIRNWWSYEIEASEENDIDKREKIYRKGLRQLPESPELKENFAIFLSKIRKDYDQAEEYYKKAIKIDPENASYFENYAIFLSDIRKDYDQAEEYYKKAIIIDPEHASYFGNYAIFLSDIRKYYDQAEEYYKKAIIIDPENASYLGNYANLLSDIRKDYNQAEEYYKKAIKIDPEDASYFGNYANLLSDIRKDYNQAEEYYKKAIKIDPEDASYFGNYAIFLSDIRKDYDQAEEYYKKAIIIDPENASYFGNYAIFLSDIRKDYDQAEEYYKKAIEIEPEDANNLGNYAKYLITVNEIQKASVIIEEAFKFNNSELESLELELWFYRYSVLFDKYEDAKVEIESLMKRGVTSPGWDLSQILSRAKELNHPDYEYLCSVNKRITSVKSKGK